jgi:ABC-type glycerol-3-phosphate transport system permease component
LSEEPPSGETEGVVVADQTAAPSPAWWQRKSVQQKIWLSVVYLLLIAVTLVLVLPLYWLLCSALKPDSDLFLYPPKLFPNPITLRNFYVAFTARPFATAPARYSFPLYVRNTLIIIVGNRVFGVTISALVAYSLARLRFRGRDLIFYTVIGAMFLPSAVLMVPRFIIFTRLKVVHTFWPLIVPGFFGYANLIFFLRQYYMTIPRELEDAAYVDGCSTFRFWWQIMLPLSKAALAVVLVMTFLYHWNDFLDPLIYLGTKAHLKTVQLAVTQLRLGYGASMAYSTLLAAPCLLVFLIAQRFFIQGIVFTGVQA